MNLSCLYHRWNAGKNAGESGVPNPASFQRHAEHCPRCAAHSQRLRSLDSRLRSLSGTGTDMVTELPGGLHAKIMAAVCEVHLSQVHAAAEKAGASKGRRGMIGAFSGVAAAVALTLFALNYDASPKAIPPDPLPAVAENKSPEPIGSPIESIEKAEGHKNFVPTATRMAQFTGELPALLVAKVSKPYDSEMEYLAADLKTATNFLSNCLFVPEVLDNSGF